MDKIVDGKRVNMGVIAFRYDSVRGFLLNKFSRDGMSGTWEFTVFGNSIEGVLTIGPARSVARRVNLKKEV